MLASSSPKKTTLKLNRTMVDNTSMPRKSKINNSIKQSQTNTVDESVVSEEPPLDSSVGEGALLKYQNLYKNAARMVEKQKIEGN